MKNAPMLGQFVVIGKDVEIGERVVIGHHVVIHDGVSIGDDVVIHDHAVIGKLLMKARHSATTSAGMQLSPTVIEASCIIGTSAVIYAGAQLKREAFAADFATIRERVIIGEGTIIGRGAAVENDCQIGNYCKLETNSYICAYSTLEDHVFIAPCVVTTNDQYLARTQARMHQFKGVTVKKGGRIAAGATILPGKVVEEDGVVAAGSVVTRDVPKREVVAGAPARKLKDVPREQWLENQ